MKEEKINSAINQYMKLLWWTDESKQGIIAKYGEDIWLSIQEICSFAANDIAWADENDIKAHEEVMKKINSAYPFLIDDSVIKIANTAAYFWK